VRGENQEKSATRATPLTAREISYVLQSSSVDLDKAAKISNREGSSAISSGGHYHGLGKLIAKGSEMCAQWSSFAALHGIEADGVASELVGRWNSPSFHSDPGGRQYWTFPIRFLRSCKP
jgi:hypothetical protein